MCVSPSGPGDKEREWASEADSKDGKRGAFRGTGPHKVTMATQHVPEDICSSLVQHPPLCAPSPATVVFDIWVVQPADYLLNVIYASLRNLKSLHQI